MMDGGMDGWTDRRTADGGRGRWTDGWMNGLMNSYPAASNGSVYLPSFISSLSPPGIA